MKKFYQNITNYSLVQQLSVIAFTFSIAIVIFFSVYLRGNINDFVNNQVTDLLRTSQNTIVTQIQSGNAGSSEIALDAQVMHFVFTRGNLSYAYSAQTYTPEFLEAVKAVAGAQKEDWTEGKIKIEGLNYYYRCSIIDKNRTIVSLLDDAYGRAIETSLLSGVSNTTAVVVTVMFMLIMIWTFSVITPLQQIRIYIDKVRKGEDATLKIDRKDEIGELANELVSLRDELKHQEETKEEMIHNISHDLKTPIATIKSYAESIKDGIYPYDTLEKSVDVIIDNANRLEQKVYSLLFLNRLDYMMDQEINTDKTTEMKKTVETVLLSLKLIRPEVIIDCDMEEAVFRGDEESWRVVVENLLDNSLRYADKNIKIFVRDGLFTITNDGPPISEERMQRLFKPFEKGTNGKFGLGLSICLKVCKTYGYDLDAENLDKGVVFRIEDKNKQNKKERKLLKSNRETKS